MANYTNKGDRLQIWQTLAANEYLQSANGMFYLMMQDNGDLCLFHGSGPNDNHQPLIWHSNTSDSVNYLVMQADGNLCLYAGSPGNQGGWRWGLNDGLNRHPFGDAANQGGVAIMQNDGNFVVYTAQGVMWATDNPPAVTQIEVTAISYDMSAMSTSDQVDPNQVPMQLKNHNNSNVAQTQQLQFSRAYQKTSSWSTTDSLTIGVSMSFSIIPELDEGNVTLSMESTHSYTSGGSITDTDTIQQTLDVVAGPHEEVICNAVLRKRTFIIPYTGRANYHYSDGAVVPAAVAGHYTGTSYFMDSEFTSTNLAAAAHA